jgi:hypothetical protein
MKDTKQVIAFVYDVGGNYVSLAARLSKEFKKVYYQAGEFVDAYPLPNKIKIGEGIEGVEVVDNWSDVFDEIDLWVFPDCYRGPFQEWLKAQGEITWGSGAAEELELYRDICKEQMTALGLPVNSWKKIVGFDALKEYLQKNKNVWVKLNHWRGLIETFFHKEYKLTEPELLDIECRLGSLKNDLDFIVEQPIDNALEQGYDGFSVDGKYPELWLSGCEIKDKAYAGQIKKYSELSPLITDFNLAFAKTFKDYGYRGFMSLENRIQGKKSFMTDFTARMPCPPGSIYLNIFKNLGEIMWAGANGEMATVFPVKQFGVELLIESQWACNHFLPIYYPDKIADQVKLKKYMVNDGICTVIPQPGCGTSDVGSVCGLGDTLEAACKSACDAAALVEGAEVVIRCDCLDGAAEALEMANKL